MSEKGKKKDSRLSMGIQKDSRDQLNVSVIEIE